MTPDKLAAARKERARRWAESGLRDYPALAAEDETEATLAAEPNKVEKKSKAHGQPD